jgi:hypothetical protein
MYNTGDIVVDAGNNGNYISVSQFKFVGGTEGLRVTEMCVAGQRKQGFQGNGTPQGVLDDFGVNVGDQLCFNRFWIDGDGHGSCSTVYVSYETSFPTVGSANCPLVNCSVFRNVKAAIRNQDYYYHFCFIAKMLQCMRNNSNPGSL